MFDTIFIGMSGLQGFSKGLKVISNNVTNMNTPGFKSASLNFTDAFYQQDQQGAGVPRGDLSARFGTGLTTLATRLNFQAGEIRHTGNALDLGISGEGYFVVRDANTGKETYTRAGQMQFDKEGELVTSVGNRYVMGYMQGNGSALGRISLAGLRVSAARATTSVKFTGNLSSSAAEFTLDGVKVVDVVGAEHGLKLKFKGKSGEPGTWTVTVLDGSTEVASGDIKFASGLPDPVNNSLSFLYTPAGAPAMDLKLDFSGDVTSFAASNTSTLAFSSHDGYPVGTVSKVSFEKDGTLALSYSNGQKAKGGQIALALFDSNRGLEQVGGAELVATGEQQARLGRPGDKGFGAIEGGQLELSNVDLSSEFSDLIVMQRGYQASSRVVSTASEMLQELFEMKGRR